VPARHLRSTEPALDSNPLFTLEHRCIIYNMNFFPCAHRWNLVCDCDWPGVPVSCEYIYTSGRNTGFSPRLPPVHEHMYIYMDTGYVWEGTSSSPSSRGYFPFTNSTRGTCPRKCPGSIFGRRRPPMICSQYYCTYGTRNDNSSRYLLSSADRRLAGSYR
jgi:hypothetical protein